MNCKFSRAQSLGVVAMVWSAYVPLAGAAGLTVPEEPPLACQTSDFRVEAVVGAGGEFPKSANCGGIPCSDYHYKVISNTLNIDHTVFAVSRTQKLLSTSPTSSVGFVGKGDTATGFLQNAVHEYSVRFDSHFSKSVELHIRTEGASKARITTALMRSGAKNAQGCLIAGPGVNASVDVFQPIMISQTVNVAGGKCVAILHYDAAGILIDVTTDTPGCLAGEPASGVVLVNGEPLRNNSSPLGITFGNGTTTCYGPPVPSIPKCICTRAPCP